MTERTEEGPTALVAANNAWAGSAILALALGLLSLLLLPLPPIGVILGMIGIAAAITARGETRSTTKRGAGASLAGFMLSLAGCIGGVLGTVG